MIKISRRLARKISLLTVVLFVLSTLGAYAQTPVNIPVNSGQPVDVSVISNLIPQLNTLQSNLRTAQNTITTLERVATPLYNKVAPSQMQSMSIAERVKAILGNAKGLLGKTLKTSGAQAKASLQAGVSPSQLPLDQQLALGLDQISAQAAKIPTKGPAAGAINKLKLILKNVTAKLQQVVNVIRAKIFAVGQKVGLISKDKTFKDGKVQDNKGSFNTKQQVQYSDTFSGKLSKGVSEGVQNAKNSLKNSFSFSNLAVTTTVAVGTNLAIDMIHGEKPSFKKAIKSVASLEFAGSIAGSALGAAGGQFASTLVKTFVPGPVGALVGSVIPVMFASATGQMGSNLITSIKQGNFSIAKAWKQIDKVDLVGSSIGSTIGMALGAPIPVIGPIIGGIVGGLLGSKVAKWVSGFAKGSKLSRLFKRGTPIGMPVGSTADRSTPVTVGAIADTPAPTSNGGPVTLGANALPVAGSAESSSELKVVEKQYYDTYLRYNRMVEAGDHDGAKKVFDELKIYSDKYTTLKKQVKTK